MAGLTPTPCWSLSPLRARARSTPDVTSRCWPTPATRSSSGLTTSWRPGSGLDARARPWSWRAWSAPSSGRGCTLPDGWRPTNTEPCNAGRACTWPRPGARTSGSLRWRRWPTAACSSPPPRRDPIRPSDWPASLTRGWCQTIWRRPCGRRLIVRWRTMPPGRSTCSSPSAEPRSETLWPAAFSRDSCQHGDRELAGLHLEPVEQRLLDRAALLSRLWDRLRVRGGRGHPHLALGLEAPGGRSRPSWRARGVGVSGGAYRRADLLRHHHPQPSPRPLVGSVRHLAGRPGNLGRHRRRRGGGAVAGAPPSQPRRPAPVHGRGGALAPGRPGHRARGQLLQPGAVRQTDQAALGPGDRPRPPALRLRAIRHIPAHLLLRDHLESGAGRGVDLAGPDAAGTSSGVLRSVRGRLLGISHLRGDAADRLLQ